MRDVIELLEEERRLEQAFAREATAEANPVGWPPEVLFSHFAAWRRRLIDGFAELKAGRPVTPPPAEIDAINDRELAAARSTPFAEAVGRSDGALSQLLELWPEIGDKPFSWYVARTTSDAVIRNSYSHPRYHLAEHFNERGDRARATELLERTLVALRKAEAPGPTLAPALYNLATMRVVDGNVTEALLLLEEAVPLRDDLRVAASQDPEFAPLRSDPRFKALVSPTTSLRA